MSKEEQSRFSNPEMKQESVTCCCNDQNLKQESSIKKVLISSRDQLSKVVKDWCEEASPIDKQGEDSKLKAEEVTNIASAKQKLTTPVLWRPWMSEVQGEAKLSSEAKQDRANMRAKLNLVTKAEEEVEKHADAKQLIYITNANPVDWQEVVGVKDKLEEVEEDSQGSVPRVIDKQDLDLVEVSVSKKVEMRLMHAIKAEAVQFKNTEVKLMEVLKQCLKLKACEKEGHEALPLLVDKQAADAG